MEVAHVAEVFLLAVHGTEAGDPEHAELLQNLSLALAEERCEPLRVEVRHHLLTNDQPELAALLNACDAEGPEDAQQVPDFGKGRPLTLGERKSLARRADRDLIARVLRDPHPDVIRILLGNPGLIEADILRLSAQRPVRGDVLREVFRHAKWVVRYPVKVALALNPYTPLDVRLQLAPHLSPQDASRMLDGPRLPSALSTVCERISGQRRVH